MNNNVCFGTYLCSVGSHHGILIKSFNDTHARAHCMCHYHRVPGEIKRREVVLDPQVSPEEIMSREVELGCESWTSFASGCSRQQQCSGHCLYDSAQARQLKQQLRSALVAAQWRGDTALTLPIFFWRRSTVSPVFFGRYPQSSLHSFVLPLSPSLISNVASVDVKQFGQAGWPIIFSFRRLTLEAAPPQN